MVGEAGKRGNRLERKSEVDSLDVVCGGRREGFGNGRGERGRVRGCAGVCGAELRRAGVDVGAGAERGN